MSTNVRMVHPDIELATAAIIVPGGRCRDPFSARRPQVPNNEQPFPFEGLPLDIQDKIFRLWLFKEGYLVHCFSRLDPYQPLEHFPTEEQLGDRRSGLPRGFFWARGRAKCSLTNDVRRPNDVLRLLLVNKHFYFIGVHCFYALNTFAFSSLGEFGRFTKGIGKARMERLQFVELMFMGNQFLTVEPENKPPRAGQPIELIEKKKLPPYSLRTSAIRCLPECRRLRTLVFHINETGKDYVRRRYESEEVKQHMIGQTRGQPNIRLSRSFRTLQGLDYLTTLRGLNWVRFYDLEQAVNAGSGERFPIRDWSFMEDITNVCTLEKVPSRKAACDIRNLTSVNPGWNPTQQHWGMVRRYFVDRAGDLSYDAVRVPVNNRDADVRSRNSAAAHSRASSSESSESDTHSRRSSSSSSSSSGSGGDGRRGDRTGRTRESILLETDIDSDSDDDRAFSAVNSVDFPRQSRGASTAVLARGRRLSTTISISSSSGSERSSQDDTTSGVGATADEPIKLGSSDDDDGGDDSNSDSESSTSDLFVNQRSGSQAGSEGSREGSETPTPTVIDLVGEDEDEDEDGTPQPAPRNGVEPSPSTSLVPFNSFLRSNQPPLWLPNRPLPGMGGSPLHSAAGATGATGSSSMPPPTRETTRESTGLFVTPTPRALVAGVPSRSITPLRPGEAGHANQDMAAEIHDLGVELEIVDLTEEPEGPYAISEGVPPQQERPSTPRASPPASPRTTKRSSVHGSRSPSPAAKRHCRTP